MIDVIVTLILVGIISLAVSYIINEKKKGRKCIGCPYAESCGKENKCTK